MNQIEREIYNLKKRVEKDTYAIMTLRTKTDTNLARIKELEALRSSFIKTFPREFTRRDARARSQAGGAQPQGKLGGNPHVNKTMQGVDINPPTPVPQASPVQQPIVNTEPPVTKVSRLHVNGKYYLKTVENVLYDPITKGEVALWDPNTRTVIDLLDNEDEDEDEELD
jgi:hypothetical protein